MPFLEDGEVVLEAEVGGAGGGGEAGEAGVVLVETDTQKSRMRIEDKDEDSRDAKHVWGPCSAC